MCWLSSSAELHTQCKIRLWKVRARQMKLGRSRGGKVSVNSQLSSSLIGTSVINGCGGRDKSLINSLISLIHVCAFLINEQRKLSKQTNLPSDSAVGLSSHLFSAVSDHVSFCPPLLWCVIVFIFCAKYPFWCCKTSAQRVIQKPGLLQLNVSKQASSKPSSHWTSFPFHGGAGANLLKYGAEHWMLHGLKWRIHFHLFSLSLPLFLFCSLSLYVSFSFCTLLFLSLSPFSLSP